METGDMDAVVAIQPPAFPLPFDPDFHWDAEALRRLLRDFPEGQFVAEVDGKVVGSCSNAVISEERWTEGKSWLDTVGEWPLPPPQPEGTTLYGLDIAVHPTYRRLGIGHEFYEARFDLVRKMGLVRYGTGCRLPGLSAQPITMTAEAYAAEVVAGHIEDRTLTPLLKMGLRYLGVKPEYMEDLESRNFGAILEWRP